MLLKSKYFSINIYPIYTKYNAKRETIKLDPFIIIRLELELKQQRDETEPFNSKKSRLQNASPYKSFE